MGPLFASNVLHAILHVMKTVPAARPCRRYYPSAYHRAASPASVHPDHRDIYLSTSMHLARISTARAASFSSNFALSEAATRHENREIERLDVVVCDSATLMPSPHGPHADCRCRSVDVRALPDMACTSNEHPGTSTARPQHLRHHSWGSILSSRRKVPTATAFCCLPCFPIWRPKAPRTYQLYPLLLLHSSTAQPSVPPSPHVLCRRKRPTQTVEISAIASKWGNGAFLYRSQRGKRAVSYHSEK